MATNALKPSLLRNVVKRGYAAQAAVQQSTYALPQQEAKVSALPSGVLVASLETNTPVSHLAVLFKAGSRYESVGNHGASHVVRSSVGLATKNKSAFAITRTLQQAGGALTAESGREHVLYGLNILRDDVDVGLDILGEVSTQPSFKSWELGDNLYRVKDDISSIDPSTVAMELLHQAAFRNSGLGNSVFIAPHRLGKLTSDTLADFVASTHTANRMAIVGHGVDHDALVSFANGLGISSGSGASSAAAYSGGEIRQENGAALTIAAVAGAGASIGSSDAASLAVAQYILGIGPSIKRGVNAGGVLGGAVASSGCVAAASAININYSDGGLFGYCIVSDPDSVGTVVKSVHSAVKNLSVSEADVARAKNQVKAAIHMATEASGDALEDMGMQALLTGNYLSPTAAAAAIDGVTTGAVQSALSQVFGGKLSMSAVGSVNNVPYLDQL